MTGFGESHCVEGGLSVTVEVRTINSRHFKLSLRTAEGYGSLEPQIEAVVRKGIRRGTVLVSLRVDRARSPDDYRINLEVLNGYRRQLEEIRHGWPSVEPPPLGSPLLLPGIVDEDAAGRVNAGEGWPVVCRAVEAAVAELNRMRIEEGRAMETDLRANCAAVAASLIEVQRRAPQVREAYRARLEERLNRLLADVPVTMNSADVLKEVGLFAERSDISEEVVRLQSHLAQFETVLDDPEGSGRKLEFLTQEMFREANTVGSKANDVDISRQVIEIKAALERIREMIQNIE
jgi:uncharacterized protein (TIGR00255 family)